MPYREDIPGHMTVNDLKVIETLASFIPEQGIVVEIGSYFGRSSWAWAHSVPPSAKVYCIDPWLGSQEYLRSLPKVKTGATLEDFLTYMKGCSNIVPIQDFSPQMPWEKSLRPDLVFVDGNHYKPHVSRDLEFWSSQLKPGGILCGHDYHPSFWPDVSEAVEQQAVRLKKPFRIFNESTVWYIELEGEAAAPHSREYEVRRVILETMSWRP